MNRNEWTFRYSAPQLADAAAKKRAHHTDRLAWWECKKAEVMEKVKAEGLEVDESIADYTSNNYGRNPTVGVRGDLLRDLQECVSKIKDHREKAQVYDGWEQVLSSQGDAPLMLHHDDWLFFFGRA